MNQNLVTNQNGLVDKLRIRANESKVFNVLCHVFALRERTRGQITIQSLSSKMKKEGFNFTKDEYRNELRFLASIGIGTLETSRRGTITALKNIKITLQSIGQAAVDSKNKIKPANFQTVYNKISLTKTPPKPKPLGGKPTLTLAINGTRMTVEVPETINPADLFTLLFEIGINPKRGEEKEQ